MGRQISILVKSYVHTVCKTDETFVVVDLSDATNKRSKFLKVSASFPLIVLISVDEEVLLSPDRYKLDEFRKLQELCAWT